MSKSFIPTRRSNPCPLCSDIKGKCRSIDHTLLCMTFADALDRIPGYRFIGRTKNDLWGKWVIDDSHYCTSEQRHQWRQEQNAKRKLRQQQEQQRCAAALPAPERDCLYGQLLAHLVLDPIDYADLIERGLSANEILSWGPKTVERWHQLEVELPHTLPGVNLDGNSLNTQSGYLCPIVDVAGYLVGCQIRLRSGDTRYVWLTSKTKKRPNGPTAHLPNGELPLAVHRPPVVERQAIALVEGVGAKPRILALRRSQVVVGAAGGQFSSSPQTLEVTLKQLSAELNTHIIEFYPDAGAIHNPHVLRQYRSTWRQLQKLGYSVQIQWWGQLSKADGDIDELSPQQLQQIRYISPADFEAIALEQGQLKHGCDEPKLLTQKEQQTQQRDLRRQLARSHYEKLTQLSSPRWKTINTPKLNFAELELETGAIYVIYSPKATGKTEGLLPTLRNFTNVYGWFSRVALGREEAHRLGVDWCEDIGSYPGALKVFFCSNSAYKFNPRHLQNNGLLLIDECDQVFDHNFSSTCNRDGVRPLILNSLPAQLAAAIAGGGTAVFMSADITDRDVEYIQALAPAGVPVRLIVNEYQPDRGLVMFDESNTPHSQMNKLMQKLEAGIPCFVIDDIKDGVRGCKSIAQWVRQQHPEWDDRIVEIHSDVSGSAEIRKLLENINEQSQSILLLCCSPSVVSGISITNGHFNRGVFGFFNGVLVVSQASQALARVRGAQEIHVWAAKQGRMYAANRAFDPQVIHQWYQSNYQANAKYLLSFDAQYCPLKQEFESPHFNLYCQNAAYRNACQADLRELLRERLQQEGYTIESMQIEGEADTVIKQELSGNWQQVELNRVRAMAATEQLSESELGRLTHATARPTREQQLQIAHTLLYKQFGPELITSMSYIHPSGEVLNGVAAMALKDYKSRYRQQLEAFRLLHCVSDEAAIKDLAPEEQQLRQSGDRFAGDVRWHSRQRQARIVLDLQPVLKPGVWFTAADYAPIVARAKAHSDLIKNTLNLSIEQMLDAQIVGELLSQIGLERECAWITPAGGGKRYRQWRIIPASWERAWQYVRYRESLRAQLELAPANVQLPVQPAQPIAATDHPPVTFSNPSSKGGDQPVPQRAIVKAMNYVNAIEAKPLVNPIPTTTEEAQEVARLIQMCDNMEALAELRKSLLGMTRELWQAAGQLLPKSKRSQVKFWMRHLLNSSELVNNSA